MTVKHYALIVVLGDIMSGRNVIQTWHVASADIRNIIQAFLWVCYRLLQYTALLIRFQPERSINICMYVWSHRWCSYHPMAPVAALHQGAPGQMTWLEDPPPWLRPACCFASVIVWTENKNVTIPDRFTCFILTVKQSAALAACVLRAMTKNNFISAKKCTPRKKSWLHPDSGWPGLRIFWPRNDLASLPCWRRHWMYLEEVNK